MRPYQYATFHRWTDIRGQPQHGIPIDEMQCCLLQMHAEQV